jgi:hypothetical protein
LPEPPFWLPLGRRMAKRQGGNLNQLSIPSEEQAPSTGGEVWAAKKNREGEIRACIVRALQQLQVPPKEWPGFVQAWQEDAHNRSTFSHTVMTPSFQPHDYNRLAGSIDQWKRLADEAWKRYRDQFVQTCEYWEEVGMDTRRSRPQEKPEARERRNATQTWSTATSGQHFGY